MITFTRHFKYTRSYISYSLKDDYNIKHRISQASAAMGALNKFWIDNTVKNISKYLIFCVIPCNLLLWGCESWEIREATLKKLEVFLHRNVRKTIKITITMGIYEKITNQSLRKWFFNIPTICNQLTKQQLPFIGKVVRNSEDQIPTKLLTACCDNKRKLGAPLQNNKKNLAQNIHLIVPGAAKDGLLTTWVYLALDDGYWKRLIKQLGTHSSTWTAPNRTQGRRHIHARHEEPPAHQHLPIDDPLQSHILLSALRIIS